ncbi:hypothetical protein [Brevibacillus parabrevis]|uniref:Uncharacterized protein n=1 Tax=Brevibacillus parabrevis TaxID=54914 RepID=A0A4Y3PTK2_BREPA|nr:hypothetical protein [Brevibacillus parabrevis]MDR4999016.1 hypothetical protein [Brevibacillus parabrevis]RNB93918.1 hypothetical protein EDM60_16000 [Brevibacillus parabrevis]WDV93627.1 hypothetical protein PSE45_18450 [Brevibacillus parabrevis]GEB34718.1 hypothetical protein BPA01_42980 [Brevibacillus parabrevis]
MNKLMLDQQLSQLTNARMRIGITDLAEDAELQPAPIIERHLAKWEFTEEGEHVRLYFNHCQFLAVPVQEEVGFALEKDAIVLTALDRRGKLKYTITFAK